MHGKGKIILEKLAQLELTEEEKQKVKEDMDEMIRYFDKLKELDTTNIEPASHILPVHNVFREDRITNGNKREQMLANAPQKKDGTFVVPKTVG